MTSKPFSPTAGLPSAVVAAFSLSAQHPQRLTSGHINQTLVAWTRSGEKIILQRLSAIFGAEVNSDLAAITAHLHEAGLETPRLLRTSDGRRWLEDAEDPRRCWRALSFVEGETLLAADSAERCHRAGQLLGRFHRCLASCDHQLVHRRLGVHDTARHLAHLEEVSRGTDHRRNRLLEPLAREVLAFAAELRLPKELPERLVHGDPKISNILFDGASGEARCLVDLDTLARMPLAVELGDALRSWCAPAGEEASDPIDVEYFRAALDGYAESAAPAEWLDVAEWRAIVPFTEGIAVELAARFCADAFEERYFGWDADRFASASEHNELRARAQLALARSIRARRETLEGMVEERWRPSRRRGSAPGRGAG